MKILVTGRDGQVARSLAAQGAGLELVFAARPQLDLLDSASIERAIDAIRPDIIVNAAAYTAVDAAEDDPETALAANGVAPGVIARVAKRIGAPMVQLSTDYVFDGKLNRPYREDDRPAPLSVYGQTKLAGEEAVVASGVPGAVVRTSWIYSAFQRNFVATMLKLGETRSEIGVVSDQIGNPTAAGDLSDAIVRLIAHWRDQGVTGMTTYHVAGTGSTSWAGLARAVFAARAARTGTITIVNDIATADYRTRAMRPRNSTLDCARLTDLLGWRMPEWQRSVATVVARSLG